MPAIREKGQLVSLIIDEPNRPLDRRPPLVTRLSLVARLSDPLVPGGRPLGGVGVRLDPGGRVPVYNLSGDPCFLDLPPGAYTLIIEGEHYFRESEPVTLPLSDPRQPVQAIVLRPLPSYPFPPGTTMIRGIVRENPDTPIAGAEVKVLRTGPQTRTTARGEFALAWPPLSADQVITERRDGIVKRFVRDDRGRKQIRVELSHPDYRKRRILIPEIEEGTTSNLGIVTVTR